jgi:uncharacterized tellurite resistance protein B-like protein
MTALDEDTAFELIKLLLQVATADHELAPAERVRLESLAGALVPDRERRAQVKRWLEGAALPPPDMGRLRAHRALVAAEARRLVLADGHVDEEERSMLAQIDALLGA